MRLKILRNLGTEFTEDDRLKEGFVGDVDDGLAELLLKRNLAEQPPVRAVPKAPKIASAAAGRSADTGAAEAK